LLAPARFARDRASASAPPARCPFYFDPFEAFHMAERARIDGIDFWRGIVLCTIFIDHLPGNILESLTPRNYGFSDAAEAFVFLSGASLALAYGTHFQPGERLKTLRSLLRRCLKLYGVHIFLSLTAIAIFVAAADWSHDPALLAEHGRDTVLNEPVNGTLGLFLLGHQLGYFNILPLYLILIAAVPLMLWLANIDRRLMLVASALLYATTRLEGWNLPSWPVQGGWFFDPLAWQLMMAIGIAVGIGLRKGDQLPKPRPLLALSVLMVFASAVVVTNAVGLAPGLRDALQPALDLGKTQLGLGRLMHFIALAYLIYTLGMTQHLREWVGYRPLALLGRHSLLVFTLVSLATAIGQVVTEMLGRSALFDVTFVAGGLSLIYAATWMVDARPDGRRPVPVPARQPSHP